MRSLASALSIAYSSTLFVVSYTVGLLFPHGILVLALSIVAVYGVGVGRSNDEESI